MKTLKPLLMLPLVATLSTTLACGPSSGGDPDGGTAEVSDEAYFNLALGTCFVFKGGLGGVQEMTIGVEEENDALGFLAKKIRYRLGGFVRRTDYVTLENGLVKIHQRSEVGTPNMDVEFSPPIDWLSRPLRPTGTNPLRTDTTATDVFTAATESWTVRTSITETQSVTVPGLPEPVDAYPTYVVYDRTDTSGGMLSEQDAFSLVPETGFVKADLHGEDMPAMDLVQIRQLPAGETTCTSG